MGYKNILRTAAAVAMAGTVMAAGAMTAPASATVTGGSARLSQESGGPGSQSETAASEENALKKGPAVLDGVIQPQNLDASLSADQLIVVAGTGGCNADVYYYKKAEDGENAESTESTVNTWNMVWKEAGIVGRGGITDQKAEGDGCTPAGTYGFTMAFGLKDDPGSILSYHKIVKGDYWVDDPASAYYNKLVNTAQTPRSWNSAEHMASASPYYNYALALDYNGDCVPGKGSAIFLHCFTATADRGSAGCIRLPEERAKELVQSVTSRTKIVIAPDLEHLK